MKKGETLKNGTGMDNDLTLTDRILYRQGTCPWWFCKAFDNPVRRWLQDPQKVLKGLVKEGQTAYDIGCGMGYFSPTLAQMVGSKGKVICVDLQKEMLAACRRRCERAGVADRMQFQQCTEDSLGLDTTADFALAFWMVHEVRDKQRFLTEIKAALKPGGILLLVEPKIHVTVKGFNTTVSIALATGFKQENGPKIPMSMAMLLRA